MFSASSVPTRGEFFSLPVTTFMTPFGNPTSLDNWAKAIVDKGVSDEGFNTHVQPAANAAAAFFVIRAKGKLF